MKHIYLNENKLSLLTEISIKDKYEKESQMGKTKLSFEDFEMLCNLDPTTKSNQVGKYANWILAKYVPNANLNELKRCLEWYADGIKRNIIKQLNISTDINSFKTYEEFINVINQISENDNAQISNSEYNNRTKLKGQFELMGSTSFYDIIKPLTYNAERYFGSHTEWCTVANDTYFDNYIKDGPLYIIYPKNGDANMKMQFHFESKSFADKNDNVWEEASECIDNVVKDENIKQELLNVGKTIWDVKDLLSFEELVNELKQCIAKGVEPSYLFGISYDAGYGLRAFTIKDYWNFLTKNGQLLSNQWFDDISKFNEHGLMEVGKYDKDNLFRYNFLKTNGKLVSPNQWFDEISEFDKNGFMKVKGDGKCNFLKTNGKLVSPNQWFDEIYEVFELFGLGEKFEVYLDDKCNYILQNGKLLSPYLWFDEVGEINDNLGVCINDEWYYIDTDKNLYSENGEFIKNLQTENAKKYQQQLIKESYNDYPLDNIESIYYRFYDDEDGREVYDVTAYDMDGNMVFDETEVSGYEVDDYFGEEIGYQIYKHQGVLNPNNGLYLLKCESPYENMGIDEIAKKMFSKRLTEYYTNFRGYIMQDGTCIDFYDNDHNYICNIPGIDDKYEFIALGNIRCGDNFFDLIQYPTYEQKICLRKLIANAEDLSIDIYDKNGDMPLTSAVYNGKVEPSIVLGQIDRFFSDGVKLNPNVDNYDDDDYLYENYHFEYNKDDVDMSSFIMQTQLNNDIWDENDILNSRVRLKLLDIADDFIETLGISWIKPKDIILTGSLCNYNWSNYSDVDLHIIIDFSEINPKKNFVQTYFNAKKNEWNESHQDLKIYGFNVELYVEDVENDSIRNGIYSLEKNIWIKKPSLNDINPLSNKKEEKIKYLASIALTKIEDLEKEFNQPFDDYSLNKLSEKIDKLLTTLKNIRQNGLKNKGEMSVGNIIYKICRRTGYLDKLWDLKNKVYDKKNSL